MPSSNTQYTSAEFHAPDPRSEVVEHRKAVTSRSAYKFTFILDRVSAVLLEQETPNTSVTPVREPVPTASNVTPIAAVEVSGELTQEQARRAVEEAFDEPAA